MRTSISSWSIRNPVPPLVLFLALTLGGMYGYWQMPVVNMPDLTVPMLTVTVAQIGASPEEMETRVTRKIEDAVVDIQHIKHIKSTVSDGISVTVLEFHQEVNLDRAFNDARSVVANIRAFLPQNIDEPLVQRVDADSMPVAVYTVIAPEMSLFSLSAYIDDDLSRQLLTLPGVSKVTRFGGVEREVVVRLNPAGLAAYGVSAAEISRILCRMYENAPGGRLEMGGREFSLRAIADSGKLSGLEQTALPLSNGKYLRLSDIADISYGGGDVRSISRLEQRPAVSFAVYRTKESSEVNVVQAVEAYLAALGESKENIHFKQIFSLASFTEETFDSAVQAFFEGTLLTVVVMFLFLRCLRSTLIATVTIPLSIIPTFAAMYFLGFTLNSVSLLAISLVIGVLVDDAIVEIENIHRHMGKGSGAYQASIAATNEIGLTVVATTAVICAVFTPVSFMGGVSGQVFRQFGLTVALAAFFSLLVARLITPLLCAYLLHEQTLSSQAVSKRKYQRVGAELLKRYTRLVRWTLHHRLLTCGLALLVLCGSFGMLPFLSTGFIPYEDYAFSNMRLELPYGSTLEQTDAVALRIAKQLKQYPEVEYVLTTVNDPGAAGGAGVNQATIEITLVPRQERVRGQKEFEHAVLEDLRAIPDIRLTVSAISGDKDISFALKSADPQVLFRVARQVEKEMRELKTINSVSSSAEQVRPEVLILPRPAQMAQLGVTTEQVSEALTVATIGDYGALLAQFNDGTRQIPIRVQLLKDRDAGLNTLANLTLVTGTGKSVPLSAVVDFQVGIGPQSLERYDRQRMVQLGANLNGIGLGDAMEQIQSLPSVKNLPESVSLEYTGDLEKMEEMNSGFAMAICTGLILVYLVQVLLYKDWIQPLTRMAALPLSIGGAFLLLLLTGTDLNMPSVIGMLTLMGIADKNSILLVDYILERLHQGIPKNEAIIEGCMARARPIIMTSLAMLAGMLPIFFGLNQQSAFRMPMAIAVTGGIVSSTLLSLVFVPVLFSCVRDFEIWLFPKLRKIIR